MGKDDDISEDVMAEFEWALKDPNEERIRELGEVVSIITSKLTEAIDNLMQDVASMKSDISSLESQVSSLSSRVTSGGAAASPSAAASEAPAMAKAPVASAPKPKPAGGGGPMTMMGELKSLLAARRKKAEGG